MPRATAISITPKLPRALPDDARRKVSTAIESLLEAVEALTAFLDEVDGDADMEDCGDAEPSLGSNAAHFGGSSWSQAPTGNDDREEQCEDEGADEHAGQGAL